MRIVSLKNLAYGNLCKATWLTALFVILLTIPTSVIQAQEKPNLAEVTTFNNLNLVGTILEEHDDYLLLLLENNRDTVQVDREAIMKMKVSGENYYYSEPLIDDYLVLLTTKSRSKLIGSIADETDHHVLFVLASSKDTITIEREEVLRMDRLMKEEKLRKKYKKKRINEVVYEKVYYKNGSIFKGDIYAEDENTLLIRLAEYGDTLALQRNMTRKILSHKNYFLFKRGRYHKKSGYHKSLMILQQYDDQSALQFQFLSYKFLNPYKGVGAGVGYSILSSPEFDFMQFADLYFYRKRYLNKGWARAYSDIKIGVAVPVGLRKTSLKVGPKLQPSLGFEIASKRNRRLTLSISQLFQYTEIDYRRRGIDAVFNVNRLFLRTSFGFGFIF